MTARDIFNGSTGNRARILILDADGLPKTGVAYNAAGLSIAYKINTGSEVAITLTSGNWSETGGGKYLVDVADSVYAVGNLGALVQFYGALTSSSVYGEQHRVVAYNPLAVAVGANTTTPPTAGAIADAVWSALTSGLSVVGSTGRALARLIGLVQDNGGDEFTVKALNRAPSGTGGDASQATLLLVKAKTDLITSQSANQQQTPVNQMVIIRGDSYSGATRKTHTVTTDYTGYTATFTIRHRVTDAVLLSVAGAVDSSTQLSVTLTTANTAFALLVDPTEFGPHPYDFRLVSGSIEKTESGIAIIRRDVTRA